MTDTVSVDSGLLRLNLREIADQAQLSLTSANRLRINIETVGQNAHVDIEGNLNEFRVNQSDFHGDLSVSENLGNLKVQGNIEATIHAQSIRKIESQQLTNALIRSAESIGRINSGNGQNNIISAALSLGRVKFSQSLTGTTLAAGTDISLMRVDGNAVDNLIMAGADLGADAQLDGVSDQFSDGTIDRLIVRGSFVGTVAAAAVNPGQDLTYFTGDDQKASTGNIKHVRFGPGALNHLPTDPVYGMIASGSIAPFKVGQTRFEAPLSEDPFRLVLLPLS